MSPWAKQFSRVGRESYQLARAVVQNRSFKSVLLDHARQSNTVANSLLQVDKQVGLVKYYGLSGYLKQRLQSTSVIPTTSTDITANTIASSDTSSSSSARVAFMVTARMKQELNGRLGYDADQIRKMTPLQASLILNESIKPEHMEERLPVAEEEYEAQRQKEAEEQVRMRIQKEEEEERNQPESIPETIDSQHQSFDSDAFSKPDYVNTNGYASVNLLDEGTESGWGDVWYEVVELKDGESNRVGLYMNEDEAKLGMKTRQDIADHKGIESVFELHQLSKENL